MIHILNKKTAQELKNVLRSKRKPTKGFNAKKFNGIIKSQDDAMKIQKKLRDEWQ